MEEGIDSTKDILVMIDQFVLNPDTVYNISTDEHIFYNELILFIQQRLSPLKGSIVKEQINDPNNSVVIVRTLSLNNPITFHYSGSLVTKMKSCFSGEDFKYILDKIERILVSRSN